MGSSVMMLADMAPYLSTWRYREQQCKKHDEKRRVTTMFHKRVMLYGTHWAALTCHRHRPGRGIH